MSAMNENLLSSVDAELPSDSRPILRDKKGRIAKGSGGVNMRGAKTHKYYAWKKQLYDAVREEVTPDDMKAIIAKIKGLALDGDKHAAQMLLGRTLGRELDGTDPRDMDLALSTPKRVEDLSTMLVELTAALAKGQISMGLATTILSALRLALAGEGVSDLEQKVQAILAMLERRGK